jgi:hypothetical protein
MGMAVPEWYGAVQCRLPLLASAAAGHSGISRSGRANPATAKQRLHARGKTFGDIDPTKEQHAHASRDKVT